MERELDEEEVWSMSDKLYFSYKWVFGRWAKTCKINWTEGVSINAYATKKFLLHVMLWRAVSIIVFDETDTSSSSWQHGAFLGDAAIVDEK